MFDCNAGIGRLAGSPLGCDAAADLLREMSRLGVREALVYHCLAAEADVELGNRLLLDAVEGNRRLYPCWVMAPPVFGDLPSPAAWVAQAVAAGVRAVRLYPSHSLYTLADWGVGPLLDALDSANLPVFLDFGTHHWSERVIPWQEIHRLCKAYPRANVVVVGVTAGAARDAVASLHRSDNLHIEYHAFNPPDGLRLLAAEGLAGRLLLGTGLPLRAGECVIEQTASSGLDARDLALVSGGNARRLVHLPEPEEARHTNLPVPVGVPIIDVHAHVGSWERTCSPVKTPDAVSDSMQRCGIAKCVASSFAAIHGEMRTGNQQTAELVRHLPGRFYGYSVITPHYPEEVAGELRQCFDCDTGFVGLKLHCGLHKAQLQHAGYEYALAFANERALPALVHGGGADKWAHVCERYPRVPFIMAHGCAWDGFDTAFRETLTVVRDTPNLFVDTAGSAAYCGALRRLVEWVGVEKVLFGSDFPMFDLGFELGRVTRSDLDLASKTAICSGNARRIFGELHNVGSD